MWRRTALIVALGLAFAARGKSLAQERCCPDLLLCDLNWVRFDVIMGRVVAVKNRAKQDRQRACRELPSGASESLAISIDRGLTSLQYLLESDSQQISIRIVRRDDVEVRWAQRHADGRHVIAVYTQVPGEDVRITVADNDGPEQEFAGPSLWHLMIAEPRVRELPIIDVLQSLKPDWRPREQADAIRTGLVETEPWHVNTSLGEVQALVHQLADKNFRIRQLADRELRARGRPVLCLLNELDPKQLDTEQRLRVEEIRRALIGDDNDTPERVTAWLINDKSVWLALMNHDDSHNRLVAQQHLARIVDRKVDFDPTAVAAVRSEQLAALRSQFTRH